MNLRALFIICLAIIGNAHSMQQEKPQFSYRKLKDAYVCDTCLETVKQDKLNAHVCPVDQVDEKDCIATGNFEVPSEDGEEIFILNRYFVQFGKKRVVCKLCNKELSQINELMTNHLKREHGFTDKK